jgi:hypothetical protein
MLPHCVHFRLPNHRLALSGGIGVVSDGGVDGTTGEVSEAARMPMAERWNTR